MHIKTQFCQCIQKKKGGDDIIFMFREFYMMVKRGRGE